MAFFARGRGVNVAALKSAARAALVMPTVFALADKVIKQPQTSFLAAFGSFAMLVLAEFAGPWRPRLLAYLGLGCAGALNITLGTLCSRTPWIGAVVMAAVGFVTLFAGVFGGYLAAAAPAAILTFVLPVTIPAPNSVVPDRLEGWGIAVGAGICAVMALWPPRNRADLSRAAAAAIRTVADFLDGIVSADEARRAVDKLGGRFLGSQHRPAGPTAPTAALTSIPDELDWLLSFVTPLPELPESEDRDAIVAAAATLRAGADRLESGEGRPDFDRLDAARDGMARAVVRRLAEVPDIESLDPPFRIRVATYSARQVAAYALVATGADVPELQESDIAHSNVGNKALVAAEQVVVEHANFGSVWFQNAIRAAAGLGLAVYIAQSTGLQHGFWVVLGTLSVLRSNALSTGWSIVTALAGTAVGIVLGATLVIGIGTHQSVLWIILPFAVLLASYAPRAISFAAGQAGFTVTLFILFNIIQPVGWRVGVVRVEDVAIGFAISLGVGLLFWPRGAAALLREQLADAFARGVDYVVIVTRELVEGGQDVPSAARAADASLHRLDDAFRQYLAERAATEFNLEDVAAAVNAATRVHRSAQSLFSLGRMATMSTSLERCGRNLDRELHALQSWYLSLGYALVNVRPVPPPHIRDAEGRRLLLECIRAGIRTSDKATTRGTVILLWTTQHIDATWRLESRIAERVNTARSQPTKAGILGRLRALAS